MWNYTFTNSVVPNHCPSPGDPSLLGTCRPAAGTARTCFSKWLTRWAWRYMCLHHCFTAAVELMVSPWKYNNKPPSCNTVDCWCRNVDVVFLPSSSSSSQVFLSPTLFARIILEQFATKRELVSPNTGIHSYQHGTVLPKLQTISHS